MTTHLKVEIHDQGPALWPEYITSASLEAIRQDLGTPIFETMYSGRRGGLAGQIIREEFFRYYKGKPTGLTYMTVDPAISMKTTADETGIVIANVDYGDPRTRREQLEAPNPGQSAAPVQATIYVRWVWHGRVGLKDQERIIVDAWDYYRPIAIGVEDVAYQSALVQLLQADHPQLPIEGYKPDRDKLSRFLALARLYEFGRVVHHGDLRASAFEWQLTHLPNARHDDMADAECGLIEMAGILGGAVVLNERPPGFK